MNTANHRVKNIYFKPVMNSAGGLGKKEELSEIRDFPFFRNFNVKFHVC